MNLTYKDAGVDVEAGNELVRRIKRLAPRIGGFAGLFPFPQGRYRDPQLVGCTDGVGTKLKLAFLLNRHDTVGIDLVAMNVNDLICCGATPLFFLDYFACSRLDVGVAETVVKGIAQGCREAGCVLLGGETAEMPGFYALGEYDLAGFALGVVERRQAITGRRIRPGDLVVGVASSGLHANGFSLVRKIFSEGELREFGPELLAPTRIYVKPLLKLLHRPGHGIKGVAHITGGGFVDNLPRILPEGCGVRIDTASWTVPELFQKIQQRGQVGMLEMYRTFNMGIGLVLVVEARAAERVRLAFTPSRVIGEVEPGRGWGAKATRRVRFV
ncbi:MAG: phosphoribosylformylglycinamidine cyclo-ligase [Elusimicrobia bacterium]|nr:phosphoribosylformylglycinamidine cyclo-ligase [Elusimicrobiota bacterium]